MAPKKWFIQNNSPHTVHLPAKDGVVSFVTPPSKEIASGQVSVNIKEMKEILQSGGTEAWQIHAANADRLQSNAPPSWWRDEFGNVHGALLFECDQRESMFVRTRCGVESENVCGLFYGEGELSCLMCKEAPWPGVYIKMGERLFVGGFDAENVPKDG